MDVLGILQITGIKGLLFEFITGGYGPGGYYFPIMCQLVFIYPLIHFFIVNLKEKGLLICFAVNALYELLATSLQISSFDFRLLIFRYIFLISFGCYFAVGGRLDTKLSIAFIILGAIFAYLISYQNITLFLYPDWASTSLLPTLMIIPLFYCLSRTTFRCKPLELLGKASYNIYLIQMLYYGFTQYVYGFIPFEWLRLVVSVTICVALGIGYYFIEKPVTNWIIGKYRLLIQYFLTLRRK